MTQPSSRPSPDRSGCGYGSMDDDDHALGCIACNLARWGEHRRDERLRRHPKRWWRRAWNAVLRFVVAGDPTLLPTTEKVGRVL